MKKVLFLLIFLISGLIFAQNDLYILVDKTEYESEEDFFGGNGGPADVRIGFNFNGYDQGRYNILSTSEALEVDYWLGYDVNHEEYDEFNFIKARLEVSGILKETKINSLQSRINIKKNQTKKSDNTGLPAYVSIVEFSTPKAYFGKK